MAKKIVKDLVPAVISISAKCSDLFSATIKDKGGSELFTYDGYVPGFFPDQHFGDYVILDIDLVTGKILNWKTPTKQQWDAFLKQARDSAERNI